MYKRVIKNQLLSLAKNYPIVTVLGPRQSGKTTLVKDAFANKVYVNLEARDVQEIALNDPRQFLSLYPNGAIFDEIQNAPVLLSYIQVLVDEVDVKGQFILTGSHQLQLHEAITQSLAGRTALLTLLPLSIQELKMADLPFTLDELLLKGGYPRIYKDHLNPTIAYKNYFQTYIERDVRQIINVKNLGLFQKFIKICAGRIGQILNYDGIANDVGVSANTIKDWISVLEASFILFRLEPYFENFGKRLIKSPKIYFTDVGFASYLLNIENLAQIQRDPLRGHLIENLVILELMKARFNMGMDHHLYFYRDQVGHEVDVIYQNGHQLFPIEVKAASTFHSSFLKNLHYFSELLPSRVQQSFLVYTGELESKIGLTKIVNYQNISQIIFKD